MKDYYLWFLIIFVMVAGCVVAYKYGYNDGYKLGITLCPAMQHTDPHDQKDYDRPDKENTPKGEINVTQ